MTKVWLSMNSNIVPATFWNSAAHPGDVIGLDKQAVSDGAYLAAYFATDPKLNSSYNYPVTCKFCFVLSCQHVNLTDYCLQVAISTPSCRQEAAWTLP